MELLESNMAWGWITYNPTSYPTCFCPSNSSNFFYNKIELKWRKKSKFKKKSETEIAEKMSKENIMWGWEDSNKK